MGIRNRERRRAKQGTREQRRRQRMASSSQAGLAAAPDEVIDTIVAAAMNAVAVGDTARLEHCVSWLAEECADGAHPVLNLRELADAVLLDRLEAAVALDWSRGWQPQDLVRLVERTRTARHARLALDAISAELRGYAPATVDERWDGQLRALDARVWWDGDAFFLSQWAGRERLDRADAIRHAIEVLHVLAGVPPLPLLCPPPGVARRGSLAGDARGDGGVRGAGGVPDERMLAKVRALLAKAESTEFAEEADAFTAKAQELMARHSIDYALLAVRQGEAEKPTGVRVGIDNPYEAAKSTLLAQVASANRCSAVWSNRLGFSTVLGHPADLESVELLYTSLLVQATTAMMREGRRVDRQGRSRTRSFRQSFLHAYAIRIGERLRDAADGVSAAVVREAGADRLLPVLAARDDAVKRVTEEMFPGLTYRQISVSNTEGWASGTAAADLASLHVRRQVADG